MTPSQRDDLLTTISARQSGESGEAYLGSKHGTAPVTIRIGYVDSSNVVQHTGIDLIDCPPAILTEVTMWAGKQEPSVFVSVTDGAVRIF